MISWCSEENRSSIDAKQKLLSEIVVVVFFFERYGKVSHVAHTRTTQPIAGMKRRTMMEVALLIHLLDIAHK